MKLSSRELKCQARKTLIGHYGLPMAAFLTIQLIVMILNLPFGVSLETNPDTFQIIIFLLSTLIISLISDVLNCGLIYIHLNLSDQKESKLSDIFFFIKNRPDRIILSSLIMTGILLLVLLPAIMFTIFAVVADTTSMYILMVFLWILTMIPFVMITLSYHLVFYLLIEYPDEPVLDILRQSRRLMSGNKGRAFYIGLSFIGMSCLSLLSLGIGLLWVNPYINQTQVKFYRNITNSIKSGPQI